MEDRIAGNYRAYGPTVCAMKLFRLCSPPMDERTLDPISGRAAVLRPCVVDNLRRPNTPVEAG